jgi:hypothetical protein
VAGGRDKTPIASAIARAQGSAAASSNSHVRSKDGRQVAKLEDSKAHVPASQLPIWHAQFRPCSCVSAAPHAHTTHAHWPGSTCGSAALLTLMTRQTTSCS